MGEQAFAHGSHRDNDYIPDLRELHQRGLLMNAKEVLALIRERVHTGQLPSGPGDKTYGSKGSNTACACCGRKIASHEIEYEVHFNSSRHAFSTHFYCYQIWWGEWRADGGHKENEPRSVSEGDLRRERTLRGTGPVDSSTIHPSAAPGPK